MYTSVWFFVGAIMSLGDDLVFRMHWRDGYTCVVSESDAIRWVETWYPVA